MRRNIIQHSSSFSKAHTTKNIPLRGGGYCPKEFWRQRTTDACHGRLLGLYGGNARTPRRGNHLDPPGRGRQRDAPRQLARIHAALAAAAGLFGRDGNQSAAVLKVELQDAAWANIGPVRSIQRLDRFEAVCARIETALTNVAIPAYSSWNQAFIEYIELDNMLVCGRAIAAAARERDGSVGGHVRSDRPNISVFAKPYSTVIRRDEDGMFMAWRISREGLPFGRMMAYLAGDSWRKAKLRVLRRLPARISDRRIRRHYEAVMNATAGPHEIEPGSLAGAPAEKVQG